MYSDYLDLAERLNETLPHKNHYSAKIYVWTNRYDTKKYGVTAAITNCKPEDADKLTWKDVAVDVAVDIKRSEMKDAVCKAYRMITDRLGIKRQVITIKLRNRKEPYVVA